jgi:hypothetical protein
MLWYKNQWPLEHHVCSSPCKTRSPHRMAGVRLIPQGSGILSGNAS